MDRVDRQIGSWTDGQIGRLVDQVGQLDQPSRLTDGYIDRPGSKVDGQTGGSADG